MYRIHAAGYGRHTRPERQGVGIPQPRHAREPRLCHRIYRRADRAVRHRRSLARLLSLSRHVRRLFGLLAPRLRTPHRPQGRHVAAGYILIRHLGRRRPRPALSPVVELPRRRHQQLHRRRGRYRTRPAPRHRTQLLGRIVDKRSLRHGAELGQRFIPAAQGAVHIRVVRRGV